MELIIKMNKIINMITNYKKNVAVDFDNTLFITEYPRIIKPIQSVINYCLELKKNDWDITLWTCRDGQDLENAIKACKEIGLEFDYVNENQPSRILAFGNDCRKIGADLYIDDKSINLTTILEYMTKETQ